MDLEIMRGNIQQFDKIAQYISWFQESNRQKVENLKKVNKPSVGFVSIYTPEEVFYAAGLVPFRITGEKGIPYNMARASLFANLCPYILSCLEEGIKDIYSFSNSIVIVNSCDARRRFYDAWKHYISAPFVHLLDFPKIVSFDSKDYFKKQIILLIKALEEHFQ
ncbi:MAG: 2-hydroxyacyl-CoA dehydratase family protein, partial [bacterium]